MAESTGAKSKGYGGGICCHNVPDSNFPEVSPMIGIRSEDQCALTTTVGNLGHQHRFGIDPGATGKGRFNVKRKRKQS